VPDDEPRDRSGPPREHTRRIIGVLQALRLALMMHMLLKAAAIPAFSRANDISRDDVLEMILSLRVEDALAQLRRAFPTRFPGIDDFTMDEAADYPAPGSGAGGQGYGALHAAFFDPIDRAHQLMLRISTAIANEFGAFG
jgi:phosphoenolpyruvate carboxylase